MAEWHHAKYCSLCGNEIEGQVHGERTGMGKSGSRRLYCSEACRDRCRRTIPLGHEIVIGGEETLKTTWRVEHGRWGWPDEWRYMRKLGEEAREGNFG